MAHWHDFNPWARNCVYISEEEMREVLGESWPDEMLSAYGTRLDAYIIPQPDGRYSFGIRYGKEGGDYLSPVIYREEGDAIMARRTA